MDGGDGEAEAMVAAGVAGVSGDAGLDRALERRP